MSNDFCTYFRAGDEASLRPRHFVNQVFSASLGELCTNEKIKSKESYLYLKDLLKDCSYTSHDFRDELDVNLEVKDKY